MGFHYFSTYSVSFSIHTNRLGKLLNSIVEEIKHLLSPESRICLNLLIIDVTVSLRVFFSFVKWKKQLGASSRLYSRYSKVHKNLRSLHLLTDVLEHHIKVQLHYQDKTSTIGAKFFQCSLICRSRQFGSVTKVCMKFVVATPKDIQQQHFLSEAVTFNFFIDCSVFMFAFC